MGIQERLANAGLLPAEATIPQGCTAEGIDPSLCCNNEITNGKRTRRGQRKNPNRKRRVRTRAPRTAAAGGSVNRGGFGAQLGSRIGASLGNFAQSAFKRLTGIGDYADDAPFEVKGNNILHPEQSVTGGQTLVNVSDLDREGAIRIRHREYLKDVTTSVAFDNGIFYLNPAYATTFPWLSTIARNFEQWVPHALVFEYVPTSGNAINGLSAALGSLSLSTQYDFTQAIFATKQQALNHYFASSGSPANPQMHPIECDPKQRPTEVLYVNLDVDAPLQDYQLYLLGATNLIAQGSPSSYNGGELWLSYDITLLKPRQSSGLITGPPVAVLYREEVIRQRLEEEKMKEADDRPLMVGPTPPTPPPSRSGLW